MVLRKSDSFTIGATPEIVNQPPKVKFQKIQPGHLQFYIYVPVCNLSTVYVEIKDSN